MITGRGLFYGAAAPDGRSLNIFNEARWDAACRQAMEWGIQIVHPKVADGPRWWYDTTGRAMLKSVAAKYHLTVAPYHYSFGGSEVVAEAQIAAVIGQEFGAVCPDMEIEYEKSPDGAKWVTTFGQVVRQHFKGDVYPTLFALPLDHPGFPYTQVEEWCSGWMPMLYFAEWRYAGHPCTAEESVNNVSYPQWQTLDNHLLTQKISPKPIMPLIEVGDHLPVSEAVAFMNMMVDYGYIGFWYDGVYSPYASAILKTPVPHLKSQPPEKPPVQPQQQGPDPRLVALWHVNDPGMQIDFALSHAIPTKWAEYIAQGKPIGSPMGPEFDVSGGKGQKFDGGNILWFEATNTTLVSLH